MYVQICSYTVYVLISPLDILEVNAENAEKCYLQENIVNSA
jgi:hypothetical protein